MRDCDVFACSACQTQFELTQNEAAERGTWVQGNGGRGGGGGGGGRELGTEWE